MFLVTFVLKFLRTSMEYFDGDDISEGKLATLRSFSASMLTTYVTLCLTQLTQLSPPHHRSDLVHLPKIVTERRQCRR